MATARSSDGESEDRILILAPWGRDGTLAAQVLREAGIESLVCSGPDELFSRYGEGAGAALVAQEALTRPVVARLKELLAEQPAWSDFPIIVFTAREASAERYRRTMKELDELGNVTALERPVHPSTLVSAAASALRARRRQYHGRDVLATREREVKQRDQFLAMLGHELRNPLAAIMNAKLLIERQLGAGSPAERPLAIVDRQIRHLTRLVDDLLDVSRVTSGKIVLKPVSMDLTGLVRTVAEEMTRSHSERKRDLRAALPDEPVAIVGDPLRVEQVVANILTNAFKYTPPGEQIEVTVCREPGVDGGHSGWGRLEVRDTGVGMTPETLATVFDPFTQADGTLDRSQGGMGLGLTVVRSLVELHGGQVSASSPGLGRGSTFVVRFPLAAQPAAVDGVGAAETATPATLCAQPRRVLVIEDSADIRESMQMLLSDLGHDVEVAVDGQQGLERALALRPEVVLVDIGLPLLDGYAVARRLRAELGDTVLLVALTGYGQPEDQSRARQAGFDKHFTKPVDARLLHRLMSTPPAAEPGTADQSLLGSHL